MLSVFCSPHRYVQGKGAILSLGEELTYLGCKDPVLIITSKSADKLLKDSWKKTFDKVSMKYIIHYFNGESSEEEIELIKSLVKKNEVKTVVGAGGGKVIDTARAVARGLDLPVISCPTIASSDSPCSALSVIYKKNGDFDHYSIHNKNPDLVLVDTEIIAKSPLRFLVAGMGDALATFFEAVTCVEGNKKNMRGGLPTQASLALAKLCYETLLESGVQACQDVGAKKVTPDLEKIVEANTLLSGLGFESCGLAAAHAIHNGLTVIPEAHSYLHGEKVAFGTLTQLVLEEKEQSLIEKVLHFATQIGLPVSLNQLGIKDPTKEVAEIIAKRACAEGETIYNEPFEIRVSDIADDILKANEIGRTYLSNI